MPPLHSLCISSPSFSNLFNSSTKSSSSSSPIPTPKTLIPDLPDLPSHIKEKILSLEIMGIDSYRALTQNPTLRDTSPDTIHHVISYLLSKGIHHKDLPRIFGMCPKILTSNIKTELAPIFSFLSNDLHVSDNNVRKVIKKCPRLLVCSVRDQLRPALIYLRRLGFDDVKALAHQDTILLVSSVENTLMPKLEFLMGLGMTKEDAVEMVLRCPGLFTFSVERNFKPKHEYFVKEMNGSLEELKEFPQYFTFSLEKRIKPRYEQMKGTGAKLELAVMLKSTDEEFQDLIHKET